MRISFAKKAPNFKMYLFALIMSSKKLISRLRMQSLIIKSQVVSEIPEIRGGHTHRRTQDGKCNRHSQPPKNIRYPWFILLGHSIWRKDLALQPILEKYPSDSMVDGLLRSFSVHKCKWLYRNHWSCPVWKISDQVTRFYIRDAKRCETNWKQD